MTTLHGTAFAATLIGALAMAGLPALANPAHHGDGPAKVAQAQGQEAGKGDPTRQQPMMGGQQMDGSGMDQGMMGGQGMGAGTGQGMKQNKNSGGMMMNPQMRTRMMQMHRMMAGQCPGMMSSPGTDSGMCSGMMAGPGMGPGMMGGPATMGLGPCGMMVEIDRDLSAQQVKDILQGQIAWTGNDRLKVGTVESKDDDTYIAEIVTVDDSLVQKLEVDRTTGAMRRVR